MTGRGAATLIGEVEKHSVAANGTVFGGVSLSTPCTQKSGSRAGILRRRHSRRARRLQFENHSGYRDGERRNRQNVQFSEVRHHNPPDDRSPQAANRVEDSTALVVRCLVTRALRGATWIRRQMPLPALDLHTYGKHILLSHY